MDDYTQLIERLNWLLPDAIGGEAAQALEALQARVADAERMKKYYSDYCNLTAAARDALQAQVTELTENLEQKENGPLGRKFYEEMSYRLQRERDVEAAERDAAVAKLRELETQEPFAYYNVGFGYYDVEKFAFHKEPTKNLDTRLWTEDKPLYTHPVPAAPTARTYMDGYSEGKAWALEAAAAICDEQLNKTNASAEKAKSVKARDIYSGAAQTSHWVRTAIRALKGGA